MNDAKPNIFQYRGSDLNSNFDEPDNFTAKDVLNQKPVSFYAANLIDALCRQELGINSAYLSDYSRKSLHYAIVERIGIREGTELTIGEYLEAMYKLVYPEPLIITVYLNVSSESKDWPLGFDLKNMNNVFQLLHIKNPSFYNFFSLLAYHRQLQNQQPAESSVDEGITVQEVEIEIGEGINVYINGERTNVTVFAEFVGHGNKYLADKVRLYLVQKLRNQICDPHSGKISIGRREAIAITKELINPQRPTRESRRTTKEEIERLAKIIQLLEQAQPQDQAPIEEERGITEPRFQEVTTALLSGRRVTRKRFIQVVSDENKYIKFALNYIVKTKVLLPFDEHLGDNYVDQESAIKIITQLHYRGYERSDHLTTMEAERIQAMLGKLQPES